MNAIRPMNEPQTVKLTVADYEMLDQAGAFASYHKTELLDGEIFGMNSQFRPHAYAKSRLARRLDRVLEAMASNLEVITEASIVMAPADEPQPDIILTNAPLEQGPIPLESVAMLIEIADSTATSDLGKKAAIYSRHAIAEYWVVEIQAGQIHQFWMPSETGYREHRRTAIGQSVTSITISGLTIATEGIA
jgi:Uma2 family endonuclease